jgi:hypothetical protein
MHYVIILRQNCLIILTEMSLTNKNVIPGYRWCTAFVRRRIQIGRGPWTWRGCTRVPDSWAWGWATPEWATVDSTSSTSSKCRKLKIKSSWFLCRRCQHLDTQSDLKDELISTEMHPITTFLSTLWGFTCNSKHQKWRFWVADNRCLRTVVYRDFCITIDVYLWI